MKYNELINFQPIETTIQLVESKKEEKKLVESYVASDKMYEIFKYSLLQQLQMDKFADNKGVLIVGNYGTGKSHLMSVISAIANDSDNLQYLQNKELADEMQCIAGKFEVLRIEIGGVTMSLREILFEHIKEDFDSKGINYTIPDFSKVKDNKEIIKDVLSAFEEKFADKGYLIVIDEFLSYLTSRDERQIVLDLEFLRALGEMCSSSKIRVVFGVQEKIFDNPKFNFVSETLKRVSDRFTQVVITKEATSFVVSERILKKDAKQKDFIRTHLEKFSNLYSSMSTDLDSFVEMFPIHPSYIDVFNKVYVIENRHILKNISVAIRAIFDNDVPEDAPGIISFDDYWNAIKLDAISKTDPNISKVLNASNQLEDIINRSFPKKHYKDMAIKIIHALSVHRLATSDIYVKNGLSAEDLKDGLCIFLDIPQKTSEFLLLLVKTILQDIMLTVSGQFIIHDESNGQYYIDVDKIVDYEEKIKQKASLISDEELNNSFYDIAYSCFDWNIKKHVTNFRIYEFDLNWESHNTFREGYLFMGLPDERSTAQPQKDFYIHIMPPFDDGSCKFTYLEDEVYFFFNSTDEFKEKLSFYTAANNLSSISADNDKEAYQSKSLSYKKELIKFLRDNQNTSFEIGYKNNKKQLITCIGGKYDKDSTFKETIDLATSISLDDYLNKKYTNYPVMKTKITRENMADNIRAAILHFTGTKNDLSKKMLSSFDLLDGDKISIDNSKYAKHYESEIKVLDKKQVINFDDIFNIKVNGFHTDKQFDIEFNFATIFFLALVYCGHAVITLENGTTITASSLDEISKTDISVLHNFKNISKPSEISLVELKKLAEVLDINPIIFDNPNDRETALEQLLSKTQALTNSCVMNKETINQTFELWGEPLLNQQQIEQVSKACDDLKNEFNNYNIKFNTPAKLINFNLSTEQIETFDTQISLVKTIPNYSDFKSDCADIVTYIYNIEYSKLPDDIQSDIEVAKSNFRSLRDDIFNGDDGKDSARQVISELDAIKTKYIEFYLKKHLQKRLDLPNAQIKSEMQDSDLIKNLGKLKDLEMLSSSKLTNLEDSIKSLEVCYDLTPESMKSNHICPHCRFNLSDNDVISDAENDVAAADILVAKKAELEELLIEWTQTLLDTIQDPLVSNTKQYLSEKQNKILDEFISKKATPEKIDIDFIDSIKALLKDIEPLIINTSDFIKKLDKLPPCDIDTFKNKINEIISEYVKDKDVEKLRILVKNNESEE